MQTRGDIQIIVQAAIMYYKEHMNQQEIAERLGLARQTVSKLLRSAEEYGIVEFRIHNPTEAMEDMSSQSITRRGGSESDNWALLGTARKLAPTGKNRFRRFLHSG